MQNNLFQIQFYIIVLNFMLLYYLYEMIFHHLINDLIFNDENAFL